MSACSSSVAVALLLQSGMAAEGRGDSVQAVRWVIEASVVVGGTVEWDAAWERVAEAGLGNRIEEHIVAE